MWRPLAARGEALGLSAREVDKLVEAMLESYDEDTLASYGTGLGQWHLWCDARGVPEHLRAPAPAPLLEYLIFESAGKYAASYISTWLSGIRAWHRVWGMPWPEQEVRRAELMRFARKRTPASSRRPPRPPVTFEWLAAITQAVRPDAPGDVAAAAAACAAFWGLLRLGEATASPKGFEERFDVARTDAVFTRSVEGQERVTISLPFTKTSPHGQRVVLVARPDPINPVQWLRRHLALNNLAGPHSLFAYTRGSRVIEMRRQTLLSRLRILARRAKVDVPDGHSFRIGGCTELLRAGNSFEDVRVHGRWTSEAWQLYVREHEEIMAPRLQLDDAALGRLAAVNRGPGVDPHAGALHDG